MKTKKVFAFLIEPGDTILIGKQPLKIKAVRYLDKQLLTFDYEGGGFGIHHKLTKEILCKI